MRVLIQRVSSASVTVNGETVGAIGPGLVVFLGIGRGDGPEEADYLVEKVVQMRIFEDEGGKMNLPVTEAGGSLLVISQFTLYGDVRKGRRPSFDAAAPPGEARLLYEYFVERARQTGVSVAVGVFQEHMMVTLTNNGPVTIFHEVARKY
jgi:D-tyrosyl-tRNA(Tyr) deacylase